MGWNKNRLVRDSSGYPMEMFWRMAALIIVCFSIAALAQQPSPPITAPLAPAAPQLQPVRPSQPPLPPPISPRPELRFAVVLDPAHGGSDTGAMMDETPEKSYTLALALRLHVLLKRDGVHTTLTRESDVSIDNTARAAIANHAYAAACILLHATNTGNGVHLFTSSLPPAGKQILADMHRSFLPWQTAQASYNTESLRLESEINSAFAQQHVPALLDRTSLMPLDSLACPAVAVEVAPMDANTALTDPAYQEKLAQALEKAIISWRGDWRLQP